MARVRREGGIACAVIAVVAVLVGWLQPSSDLTRGDARDFTKTALEDIGLERVRVGDNVSEGRYTPRGSTTSITVWVTTATVAGGKVTLKVDRAHGAAVFVDDMASDGGRLLTNAQFDALGKVTSDPARGRRIARNVAGTIAGLFAAGMAVLATAVIPNRLEDAL